MFITKRYLEETTKKDYVIYCDMDSVLVDFKKQALKTEPNIKFKPHDNTEEQKKLWNDLWKTVTKTSPNWWASMSWTQDGRTLWQYIKPHDPFILSAAPPSIFEKTKKGKLEWIRKNLGKDFVNRALIVDRSEKLQYATPNAVLIDDELRNCDEFKRAGGICIKHTSTRETIRQLRKLGL